MKQRPFKFELETVLRVRKRDTDRAQEVVSMAAARVRAQRVVIDEFEGQLQTQLSASTNGLGRDELQLMRRHSARLAQLRTRIRQERMTLEELEAQEESERSKLLACKMKEESVSKLREQAFERYKREAAQAENAMADEITQMATARSTSGHR